MNIAANDSTTKPWSKTLVVIEPDSSTTKAFAAHLRAIFPDWEIQANPEHDPLDIGEGVIVLGPRLTQETREQLIASFLGRNKIAIVVILATERDPLLHHIVRSGVHGVGFADAPSSSIKRVVANALVAREKRSQNRQTVPHERIVNFSWLLEELANSLESLAAEVRNGYRGDEPPAHSFQVKRAIAGALGQWQRKESLDGRH